MCFNGWAGRVCLLLSVVDCLSVLLCVCARVFWALGALDPGEPDLLHELGRLLGGRHLREEGGGTGQAGGQVGRAVEGQWKGGGKAVEKAAVRSRKRQRRKAGVRTPAATVMDSNGVP